MRAGPGRRDGPGVLEPVRQREAVSGDPRGGSEAGVAGAVCANPGGAVSFAKVEEAFRA